MNLLITLMCAGMTVAAAAHLGYNYNPLKPGAKQNLRPQASASNNAIFSGQQAPPLPSVNLQIAPPAAQYAPQPIDIPPPPRQYVQQQQFPQHIAPIQQPAAYAPNSAAAPSGSAQIHYNQAATPSSPAQIHYNQAATPSSPAQIQYNQAAAPSGSAQIHYNQAAAPSSPALIQYNQAAAPSSSAQIQYNQAAASASSAQIQFNQAAAGSGSSQTQYNQQQTIISKDIYIHSAPEETEEIHNEQSIENGPIRKNYRIIFIKAPTQNIRYYAQAIKRNQAANEEKTVIYVLSKKPDITNIQNQLTTIQNEQKSHKPEVYFIKYKTPEEAIRAQQEIQAQYEALGGSTRVSDEGFAPVTSVSGSGTINLGSADHNLSSSSAGGLSFSGNANFAQSPTNNQQQFVQSSAIQGNQGSASSTSFAISTQGNQGPASSTSFAISTPGPTYLSPKKK